MKKKISIIIFGIILAIFIGITRVEAASANISATRTTAEVGDNVSITVNFTAAAWNLQVSGEGVNSKGYASQTSDLSEQNTTESLRLDTSKVGTYTIRLFGDITDQNGNTIDINTSTIVTINEKVVQQPDPTPEPPSNTETTDKPKEETPKKSTNANLKMLGITPNDFKGFKANRKEYTTTVPNNIEEVEVYYELPSDSKSTVNITAGSGLKVNNRKVSGLKEGKNVITITVTAEAGNKRSYRITVTRQVANEPVETPTEDPTTEEPEENPDEETPQEETAEPGEGIKELTIAGITLKPEFNTDIYEYEAVLTEDKDMLDIKAITTSEDYKVVIAGNEDLQNGENMITLIVYDAQNTVVATYQITVMKNTVDQNEINDIFGQAKKEEKIKRIVLITVAVIVAILIIIYIIIRVKMKKSKGKGKREKESDFGLNDEWENYMKLDTENEVEENKEQNEGENNEEKQRRGRRAKTEDIENKEDILIRNSILIEEDEEKEDEAEEKATRRGRRKVEKEEEMELERNWREFDNSLKIEGIEDNTDPTEKKKGKHF